MKATGKQAVFLCNEATPSEGLDEGGYRRLAYRSARGERPVIRLALPDFVRSVNHLPDRCLDLLEIAAYVFSGDRLTSRGPTDAVEYQSWSRRFRFIVKVRDYKFWDQPEVREALGKALCFATGDSAYEFTFQPGHQTPATNLFDRKEFLIKNGGDIAIMLFSGGIDSLAGGVHQLENTNSHICLVSHLAQAGTMRTQRKLADALKDQYEGRVSAYQFKTTLQGERAKEETQRSRPFLYGSIAFALATALGQDRCYVHENGVTSLNFSRRGDLLNARASRTTHPQTIGRLAALFSMISGKRFTIETPFLWLTKADVVTELMRAGCGHLLPSSVSCSRTYNAGVNTTHCGECFQCLDRRIGIYGAQANERDNETLYAKNIITSKMSPKEGKTTAVDYLRQASHFASWNSAAFEHHSLDELQSLMEWVPDFENEVDLVEQVWSLCARHGRQVRESLRRMRDVHEDVFTPQEPGCLLNVISDREFLKAPIERLVRSIEERLDSALPKSFRIQDPVNEADLNDKIEGLLDTWRDDLRREHPAVPFATVGVRPDFTLDKAHLLIEGKYIRASTTPAKVTEGMSADLIKYPEEAHILFVVYDPGRAVADRSRFRKDFESKGRCTVCILP